MVTPDSTSLKRCSHKSNCVHPDTQDGWLPAAPEYFHRKKDSSDGLNNKCKKCNYADSRAWAVKNTERAHEYMQQYREENKAALLEQKKQYHLKHRERHLREFKAYDAKHADRRKLQRRSHYAANAPRLRVALHQRRAKRRNAPGRYTERDVALLLRSQKQLCWWCGKKVDPDNYHVDHRIPLSRGGTNYPENLCIACPTCNLSKHNKLPQEWSGRLL